MGASATRTARAGRWNWGGLIADDARAQIVVRPSALPYSMHDAGVLVLGRVVPAKPSWSSPGHRSVKPSFKRRHAFPAGRLPQLLPVDRSQPAWCQRWSRWKTGRRAVRTGRAGIHVR
jgi:hypothetical protein